MTAARIEIVDARDHVSVARILLQAAWKPPCLHYSADYLAWQFGFSCETRATGAIAFVEDKPVGCIATTGRQFRYAQTEFSGRVLSFVAVDPAVSGRGVGSELYAAFLDTLPGHTPILAFTEPGTVGERLLISSIARANFRHRTLRVCRAVGYLNRSTVLFSPLSETVRDVGTYEEFAAANEFANGTATMWTHFTRKQWEHYRNDPRGRVMLTIHDDSGSPLGTAMMVSAEVVSAQGLQRVTMLDSVALHKPTPQAVAAVFRFAAMRAQTGLTVIASNLSYIDNEILRASGARTLPSSFNAHLFIKSERHIVEQASSVNLEVT
jgi:GNAT superfamily N-acetyltransferase